MTRRSRAGALEIGIVMALTAVAPSRASAWTPLSPAAFSEAASAAAPADESSAASEETPAVDEAGAPAPGEPATSSPPVPAPPALVAPARVGASTLALERTSQSRPTERPRSGGKVLLWTLVGALVLTSAAVIVVLNRPSYDAYPGTLGTVEIP